MWLGERDAATRPWTPARASAVADATEEAASGTRGRGCRQLSQAAFVAVRCYTKDLGTGRTGVPGGIGRSCSGLQLDGCQVDIPLVLECRDPQSTQGEDGSVAGVARLKSTSTAPLAGRQAGRSTASEPCALKLETEQRVV
jgi:hypothetical protein